MKRFHQAQIRLVKIKSTNFMCIEIKPTIEFIKGIGEGGGGENVLFNNALNTFYLRLYGIRHMVKNHSDRERGNALPPHRLLFPISLCYSSRWALAGMRNNPMGPPLRIDTMTHRTMSKCSYHRATSCSLTEFVSKKTLFSMLYITKGTFSSFFLVFLTCYMHNYKHF